MKEEEINNPELTGLTAEETAELEAEIGGSKDKEPTAKDATSPEASKKPEEPKPEIKPAPEQKEKADPELDAFNKMTQEDLIKHAKGLQKAVVEERGKRHKTEEERNTKISGLNDQIAYLQGRIDEMAKNPSISDTDEVDPLADITDEEPVTAGQIKKAIEFQQKKANHMQQSQREQFMREEVKRKNSLWNETKTKAEQNLTAEKMGEGLDFDSVFERTKSVCHKNLYYVQAIENAEDPAQAAYEIGLLHPDSRQAMEARYKSQGATEIVGKLNAPKPTTIKSASASAGGGPKLSDLSLEKLNKNPKISEDDIMAELERTESEGG